MSDQSPLHPQTVAIRGAFRRSDRNEHSTPLYLTSSFVTDTALEAKLFFSGEVQRDTYSRFTNPTVTQFQERVAMLEGAERAMATASGMGAITSTLLTLLKTGDGIISSRSLFGATIGMLNGVISKLGIDTSYVPIDDPDAWRRAIKPNSKLMFVETPSNPLTEVADIGTLSRIAKEHGLLLVVDNSFCSPIIQRPLELGADLVIHSATKLIDGHGRVLGGVVCGSDKLVEQIYLFVRSTGISLSSFNAWVLLNGLETLPLRVQHASANALEIAQFLQSHSKIEKVIYPALKSHPQYALAMQQQNGFGGSVISFRIGSASCESQAAWNLIDKVQIFSRTGNLGDVKSTITHPYTTTHWKLSPEEKADSGITPNLIRLSIGLEHPRDLINDLQQAMDQSSRL